jgi:hypothetical protein
VRRGASVSEVLQKQLRHLPCDITMLKPHSCKGNEVFDHDIDTVPHDSRNIELILPILSDVWSFIEVKMVIEF